MRVTVVRSGGIAGLLMTTTLDTATLDAAASTTLRELVAACSFTDRRPTPVVDGVRVELSVEDDEPHRPASRVRFDEHDPPEGVERVLNWLGDQPAAQRSVGR